MINTVPGNVEIRVIYTPQQTLESSCMLLVDKNKTYYVHCAGGYRSMVFASILRARGYENLVDVNGGFTAIKESDKFKISDYVCPSTML